MKAVSLTQPFATLVVIGAKLYETRSWKVAYRGDLAIHAAKGFPKSARQLCFQGPFFRELSKVGIYHPDDLPRGAVLGTCRMTGCYLITPVCLLSLDALWDGMEDIALPGEPERSFGDYTPGRYAWRLEDAQAFTEPVPAKGALGLWEWEGAA